MRIPASVRLPFFQHTSPEKSAEDEQNDQGNSFKNIACDLTHGEQANQFKAELRQSNRRCQSCVTIALSESEREKTAIDGRYAFSPTRQLGSPFARSWSTRAPTQNANALDPHFALDQEISPRSPAVGLEFVAVLIELTVLAFKTITGVDKNSRSTNAIQHHRRRYPQNHFHRSTLLT